MKKVIYPIGLKGNEINERMKELMGIKPINENNSKIVVELTKMGPDGNAYAIIRENHEWYIKKTNKNKNILAEDFNYIGGLKNKKMEAYPSYAKAIKHLNLKFKSLAEAFNFNGEINVFENDNLINETGLVGFSEMKDMGFTGEGNLEGNKSMDESEETFDEIEMSESEMAIDKIIDEMKGPWGDNENNGDDIINNNADEIKETSSKIGSAEPMDLRNAEEKKISNKIFGEKPKKEPKNGKDLKKKV